MTKLFMRYWFGGTYGPRRRESEEFFRKKISVPDKRIPHEELRDKRGFTLIELLLSISIIGILIIGITDFYLTIVSSRVKNQTITEVEQQGSDSLRLINQLIRNAENITTPTIGASSASLTLDVVDSGKDPTVIDSSLGRLRVTEGAGSPVFLTSSALTLSNLTFSNLSRVSTPGTIQTTFTFTRVNTAGKHEYDYAKTFTSSASLH